MSFLTRYASSLTGWFARTFLAVKPYQARRALGQFLQHGTAWGPYSQLSIESRHEQVRHFRNWVYVAVDRICSEFAMHQPNVSLVRDPSSPGADPRKFLSEALRRKAITPLRAHEQLEPVSPHHPLVRLLSDPNEPDTSYDLWYETALFMLLTGSAYWWMPQNSLKKPAAIWVIPSHWVWPHYDRSGALTSYFLRPVEGNYIHARIPASDVIQFRKKSPISKIDGYSPQAAISQWIDSEESVSRCRWFSFKNGLFPGVTIEFDAEAHLPEPEQLDRLEARIMQRYGGEQNTNRPMFVPPGAKVRKLSLTPGEMGCFESEEQLRDMILSAFRVPPASVGLVKNMTYGSIQASRVELYTGAINPLYHYCGQNLTEKLAQPRYNRNLKVWWEDRTPQDPELLEKQLTTDKSYGAKTINQVRALRGDEPFNEPWANEPWLPLNMRPISMILKMAESEVALSDPAQQPDGGAPGMTPTAVDSPENTPRLNDDNLHVNG